LDLEKETKQKDKHTHTLACLWWATVKVVSVVSVVERDYMGVVSRLRANLHQVQNYLSGLGVKSTIEFINYNGRSLAKAVFDFCN
tara:strand:- start:1790 stop:2044 length:255 start_codon:yes stop_codon:yes gene_type:complete